MLNLRKFSLFQQYGIFQSVVNQVNANETCNLQNYIVVGSISYQKNNRICPVRTTTSNLKSAIKYETEN